MPLSPWRLHVVVSLLAVGGFRVAWARSSLYEKVPGTCRMESQFYLEPRFFGLITCARCYKYMASLAFKNASRLTYCRGARLCRGGCDGECYTPYGNKSDVEIVDTFAKKLYADRWESCCRAAKQCCQEMLEDELAEPRDTKAGPRCPATWDGWTCFKDTPAGTTVRKPCPTHAYFITETPQCIKTSKKICWDNGTWYYSQEYGKEYTFYDCGSLEYHRSMTIFSIVLHSLSVVVLVPAIVIFSVYKQLQVHRISLHKNFCVAMVLYDISVILVDSVFILDHVNEEKNIRVNQNPNLCKVLYTLSRYFRLCQYAWMFCEGFYLHKLIASAFAEQKSLLIFYVVGWGCPAVFVSISAILRAVRTGHPCWMDNVEGYNWITLAPGLFCLFANFIFLCNIIRVLVTKLRSTHANEPSQFRKAVRAVLVLFPLFGMHFLMTVYRSPSNCGAWEVYQYISKASDGLQARQIFQYLQTRCSPMLLLFCEIRSPDQAVN
ncbi:calcitonin gene-related peptide type 1 receptor-like [Rhipicephalus sanguineus]|uniref:calcitonin gene-related peptide type 1 receptor-like n=1 Tax=Rhipicephalus sanguineus TaxID=34632 RepID=UPI0020C28BB0|nr:calcitonin gene-related peptide type 1 receptor-like [Rhipicephalus sanguineus]